MKCSKCGKRFNSLPAMAKHYRKKHPQAMKRKTRVERAQDAPSKQSSYSYCPNCGHDLR